MKFRKRLLLWMFPGLVLAGCAFGDNELRTRGAAAELVLHEYCEFEARCSGERWFEENYGSIDDCTTYWEVYYRPYVEWDVKSGDWEQVLRCADDLRDLACGQQIPPSCVNVLDL